MNKVSKATSSKSASSEGPKKVASEYEQLRAQFDKILSDVKTLVIEPQKHNGTVVISENQFRFEAKRSDRDQARSLVGLGISLPADFSAPTKLTLVNTLKTPEIQKIEITIPRVGNDTGTVSLISVTYKNKQTVSFTPSSDTFIKRQEGEKKRTRITPQATTQE